MSQYTVSKLARRVGTSPDTLRYYERIGLLPAERTSSGYRLYDDDAVARFLFIKSAQRLGLSLEDIGELLAIRVDGLCPCGRTRQLLVDKLAELESELEDLLRLRGEIQRMLDEGPLRPNDGWGCGCGPPLLRITTKGGMT